MKEPTVRIQKVRRDTVKTRLLLFGTLAVLLLLCSVFCDYLTPCDPYLQDLSNAKAAPSAEHFFGTDRYGRDMLSRVIAGSRTSILSTLLLVAIITVLGTGIGVFCGWHGKWIDTLLMRVSDMFLAFPGLVFALAVAGVLGGGLQNAIIALAAISWPKYARIARVGFEVDRAAAIFLALQNVYNGIGIPMIRIGGFGIRSFDPILALICSRVKNHFFLQLFGDLHRAAAFHAKVKDVAHDLGGFLIDDPFFLVLRIFTVAVRRIDRQTLAAFALGLIDRSDLPTGIAGVELVEPHANPGKVVIHAVLILLDWPVEQHSTAKFRYRQPAFFCFVGDQFVHILRNANKDLLFFCSEFHFLSSHFFSF